MNIWKPAAISLATALVASIGIQTALADKNQPPPSNIGGGCGPGQPNMAAALSSLQSALASLQKAEHNKGGWRVAAINSTQAAITQTTNGCNAAN